MTGRSGMPTGMGRFRKAIAGLLALALLALPGAPVRHASAAAPPEQHAAHHCVTHGHMAQDPAPGSHHHDHGQPGRHPGEVQDLACCASAQCPATVAVPLAPPGQPLTPFSLRLVGIAAHSMPDGVAVDPPLHPPRPLA